MEIIFLPPATQSGFRLELLFNAPVKGELFEEIQAPFYTLFDTGRYAKVLGAQVVSRENHPVFRLAIKIQKDQYSLGLGANAGSQETNTNVDQMWERELDNLRKFTAPDSPVGSLFEWGMKQPIKPVLFCKKKRVFLRPHCPVCSQTLSTCREDLPLSRRALTLYSQGVNRYLCCPDCARKDPENVPLYSHQPSENDLSRGVLGPSDLYRNTIGSRIQAPPPKPKDEALRRELAEDLCCLACDSRDACFGSGEDSRNRSEASRVIAPLGFYDFFLLPQEYLLLRYDEHNKLLSGSAPDALHTPVWPPSPDAPDDSPPERNSPHEGRRNFLFPPDDQRALEIFYLKTTAFQQLCEDLRTFYRVCGQPHLQLGPDNVMVTLSENGSHLPLAWNFHVKLIDLASGHPFRPAPGLTDYLPDIRRPIRDQDRLYAAPVLHEKFGQQNWMKIILKDISETPLDGGDVLFKIHGTLSSDAVDLQEISRKDLLHLALHQEHLGLTGTEFWGKKLAQEEKICSIECCSFQITKKEKERMQTLRDREIDVLVSCFPVYHLPCDLYSLGLLLLDSLLANPANERLDIRETHHTLCQLMESYMYNHPLADESEVIQTFREICVTDRASRVLARSNIFFQPQENAASASAIPEILWFEALLIAFRLSSHLPVFSFCRDHGDFSEDRPEEKLDHLVHALDALRAKIHTELFATHQANDQITRILKKVAAEERKPPAADTPLPLTVHGKPLEPESAAEGTQAGSHATEDPKEP